MTTHRALVIPANPSIPITEVQVPSEWPGLKELIGGWVERVTTPQLHALAHDDYDPIARAGGSRFPTVTAWMDEEGLIKRLSPNPRASLFYPNSATPLCGTVVLLGEDLVPDEDGFEEPDITSLPDDVTAESVNDAIWRLEHQWAGRGQG